MFMSVLVHTLYNRLKLSLLNPYNEVQNVSDFKSLKAYMKNLLNPFAELLDTIFSNIYLPDLCAFKYL